MLGVANTKVFVLLAHTGDLQANKVVLNKAGRTAMPKRVSLPGLVLKECAKRAQRFVKQICGRGWPPKALQSFNVHVIIASLFGRRTFAPISLTLPTCKTKVDEGRIGMTYCPLKQSLAISYGSLRLPLNR